MPGVEVVSLRCRKHSFVYIVVFHFDGGVCCGDVLNVEELGKEEHIVQCCLIAVAMVVVDIVDVAANNISQPVNITIDSR